MGKRKYKHLSEADRLKIYEHLSDAGSPRALQMTCLNLFNLLPCVTLSHRSPFCSRFHKA